MIWSGAARLNWACVLMEMLGSSSLKDIPLLVSGHRSLNSSPVFDAYPGLPQIARRLLPKYHSERLLRRAAVRYRDEPAALYRIDVKTLTFERGFDLEPKEIQEARQQLTEHIEPATRRLRLPREGETVGVLLREDNRQTFVPLVGLPSPEPPTVKPRSSRIRQPIHISLQALIDQAREMDQADAGAVRAGNWEQRLRNLVIESTSASPSRDQLTLEGMKHLIGLPGAGKTTVLMILSRWLALNGYRTAIFFPSVEVARSYLVDLRRYGVRTGLLMGSAPSTRLAHAQRVADLAATDHPLRGLGAIIEAGDLFSAGCPILAYAEKDLLSLGVSFGPRCDDLRIRSVNEGKAKDRRCDCPLWWQCGYQRATRELEDAQLWVGHIASVDRDVSVHQRRQRERYFDLIAREFDVVIFDECDAVQTWLDQSGVNELKLTGHRQSLNSMLANKQREVSIDENVTLSKGGLEFSMVVSDFTAMNQRLVRTIQELSADRRSRLAGTVMTTHRLVSDLISGNRPLNDEDQRLDPLLQVKSGLIQLVEEAAIEAFCSRLEQTELHGGANRRSAKLEARERLAVDLVLDNQALDQTHQRLVLIMRQWLSERDVDEFGTHIGEAISTLNAVDGLRAFFDPENPSSEGSVELLFCVVFTLLAYRRLTPFTHQLYEDEFLPTELVDDRCSEQLLRATVENALGGFSGIRFFDEPSSGSAEATAVTVRLQYLVFDGAPRALMYHLHEYQPHLGCAGPQVLLASATSFLEHSPAYHVPAEPNYLVSKTPAKAAESTEPSRYVFYPIADERRPGRFLRFSGLRDLDARHRNLERMVDALLDGGPRQSIVSEHLEALSTPRRRKAAFIVNSYEQVRLIKRYIDRRFPEWSASVVGIVDRVASGDSGGLIPRGQVESLGDRDEIEIVVFPLRAIGRGVNVVFSRGLGVRQAALGALYFLTRPHPPSNDLSLLVSLAAEDSEAFNRTDLADVGTLAGLAQCRREVRNRAFGRIGRLLATPLMARRLGDLFLPFSANMAVEVLQTIGRAMRGGAAVHVYFVDVAWAPKSAAGLPDDRQSSMLVQFIEILEALTHHENDRHRRIYKSLYDAFYQPFRLTEGLHRSGEERGDDHQRFTDSVICKPE